MIALSAHQQLEIIQAIDALAKAPLLRSQDGHRRDRLLEAALREMANRDDWLATLGTLFLLLWFAASLLAGADDRIAELDQMERRLSGLPPNAPPPDVSNRWLDLMNRLSSRTWAVAKREE